MGLYAADEHGYYNTEGLSARYVEGGAGVDLTNSVLDGTAQFAVDGADSLIVSRAEGKPVVGITVVFRRNPLVFFAMAAPKISWENQANSAKLAGPIKGS